MFRCALLFLCCLLIRLDGAAVSLTKPPKGWECIRDPEQLPQKIQALYVGKGNGNASFAPSINVAKEATALSLKEYVKLAKSYHEGQRDVQCTLLGAMKTEAGMMELMQIDRTSQWGAVRFVQAYLIEGGEAYVVTATCLKQEFSALASQLHKAMQSFTLVPEEKMLHTN